MVSKTEIDKIWKWKFEFRFSKSFHSWPKYHPVKYDGIYIYLQLILLKTGILSNKISVHRVVAWFWKNATSFRHCFNLQGLQKYRGVQSLHAWDPSHKVRQGGKGSVWAPYVVIYVSYRKCMGTLGGHRAHFLYFWVAEVEQQ